MMIEYLSNLPKEAAVFIISMMPVGELRLAIPLAVNKFDMGIKEAFIISVLGNILPVIFIVYFLEDASKYLSHKSKFFHNFFEKLFEKTRKKHGKKFEVYEEIALVSFVAIPLPLTGAWSGALAAFVFGIPPKKSIPLICLGVFIAGVIVSILTVGVGSLFN